VVSSLKPYLHNSDMTSENRLRENSLLVSDIAPRQKTNRARRFKKS